ncbi:MAG: hypothetical protein GEV09_22640 [Pseudonocardiaceae bacterium]|nr:hypothetical protein [Pseudonocardiaceae bacterium]
MGLRHKIKNLAAQVTGNAGEVTEQPENKPGHEAALLTSDEFTPPTATIDDQPVPPTGDEPAEQPTSERDDSSTDTSAKDSPP